MKILRIISSMNPNSGGPCQGIRNSVPAMKLLGVENEVLCLDNSDADFLKKDSFPIHAIGASKGSWCYNSALPHWLTKHSSEYDIIIIHGLWLYHSYASIKTILNLRKSTTGPRIYIMPHGMLDPWFQRDKTRKMKALRNEIYWRLIEKKVVNSADGLLFTCEKELLLARDTFKGYHPKQELNVSYGVQAPPEYSIEMNEAFRLKATKLGESSYLLFLSRIHAKKGVDILIEGYRQLRHQGTELPNLVIAGPIEGEYAEALYTKYAHDPNIHFVGMLQASEKWGAFYGCEAFILPSHQENFGIAVVEALASGKPVLISNQINIFSEIKDAGAGIIEEDTLEGVKSLFITWNSLTKTERDNMALRAKNTYTNYYSVTKSASRLKVALEQSKNLMFTND